MPFTPTTWLDAVTVNTTTAGTRADSRVTVLSNGNILISWTETTQAPGAPATSNIVGQILDPLGNPVNGEFIINVGSEGHLAGNSDIQATADGGFFAVFERNQASLEDVLIIRFDAAGTPSPAGNLFFDVTLSGAAPSGFDPQVAIASETSGLAVWRQTTETGESILRGFVFDASSPASAGNDDPNLFDLATGAGVQGEPALVALATGSYAVAVQADVDGDNQIRLYIVNDEGGVSNARDAIIGQTGVVDMAPSLTPLGNRFVMTWSADGVIQVQLFDSAGQTVGAQNSVPGLTVGEGDRPVIQDLSGNHYAVVVTDSSTGTIHVQRFDVTGEPVGARGVFHTADAGSPPDLALMPDGRLVVTFIDASGQVAMEILDTRDATGEAGTMITGTIGDDVISYEGPATYVGGGAGDDTINATPTDPFRTFDGGDGDDRINVGSVVNGDIYLGGRGADTIDWSGSGDLDLVIDLAAGIARFDSFTEVMRGFEHAVGTQGDDHIIGDSSDNVLEGLGGDDQIEGGAGDDQLRGGEGDDTLDGGEGADSFEGGAGIDTVDYSDASERVYADLLFDNALFGAAGDSFSGIENLIGSSFNDTLLGGDLDNLLQGGDGNDVLIGDDGDDILQGETGDDQLFGGEGNDALFGGDGDDYLEGRSGNNTLDGGDGFDIASYDELDENVRVDLLTGFNNRGDTLINIEGVMGGDGDDELTGDDGDNVLIGSSGDDWIIGGGGADDLDGGSGDFDTVDYRTSSAGVTISLLNNTASGGDAAGDILSGFENVSGSLFADTLTGDARDNYLEGFGGADVLNGGAGVDTLSYFSSSGGVTVSLLDNTASGADAEGYVFSNFENILGSNFGDVLTGDGGANRIEGRDGDDIIAGGAGADDLNGGEGIDTLSYAGSAGGVTVNLLTGAASGADADGDLFSEFENLMGSAHDDVLQGDAGSNRLDGGLGDDTLGGFTGDDVLNGGGGRDTLNGGSGNDQLSGDADNDVLNGGAGDDILSGSSGNDELNGAAGADLLTGGTGADTLNGGADADTLNGGADNDVLNGGAGADVLIGGSGVDTASYLGTDAAVTVNLATGAGIGGFAEGDTLAGIENVQAGNHNDTLIGDGVANLLNGGGGDDFLEGGAGDDVLQGSSGADEMYGGDGSDNVAGGTGDDVIGGGAGHDILNGGSGADVIDGDGGDDHLLGGQDNDVLRGGNGSDRLEGGQGDDLLDGGAGSDVLAGGAGSDLFDFSGAWGQDIIADFEAGSVLSDKIVFSKADFSSYSVMLASAVDTEAGVVITASDGRTVTLTGVAKADLRPNDFTFTQVPAAAALDPLMIPDLASPETKTGEALVLPGMEVSRPDLGSFDAALDVRDLSRALAGHDSGLDWLI